MTIPDQIPSVHYHLWRACDMRCVFCFATFQDIEVELLPKGHLGRDDSLAVVDSLAYAGFEKLNFAGGEPTLCPWLPDLIRRANDLGMTTSVVTNGSLITDDWLDQIDGGLCWATLSIDSAHSDTLLRTGRTTRSGPMSALDYMDERPGLYERDWYPQETQH